MTDLTHTPDCKAHRYVMSDGLCTCGRDAAASGELIPRADALQARVWPWMLTCFGEEVSRDKEERGDRLLEEVFELLQSGGYDPARVLALRDYVWSRDVGEPAQEVGGVMITLAAYCLAHDLDMHKAGETELARIWTKVEKIRAKQAAKPKGGALPQEWPSTQSGELFPLADHKLAVAEAYRQALGAIADLPTPPSEETMGGHEDAYRAVAAIAPTDALAELQALRAELAATQAKLARVVGALKGLDKAATEVSRLGAVTGSQWSRLTVASLAARAALEGAKP